MTSISLKIVKVVILSDNNCHFVPLLSLKQHLFSSQLKISHVLNRTTSKSSTQKMRMCLIVGKTLVKAGTTTAGSITGVFSVIGIAMGIWEVVGSAKKIQDGSELADEFREQANELEKVMKNLIELDEELQS